MIQKCLNIFGLIFWFEIIIKNDNYKQSKYEFADWTATTRNHISFAVVYSHMFAIYGLGMGEVLVIVAVAVVITFITGMWAGRKASDAARRSQE